MEFHVYALITTVLILKYFSLVKCENSLRVCTKDGELHKISTKSCHRGGWASSGLEVDCVCGSGLWVLSNEFCSANFILLAGREFDCFKLNRTVARFISLISNDDLARGKLYYIQGKLETFRDFRDNLTVSSPRNEDDDLMSYILRYRHSTEVEDEIPTSSTPIYMRHEEGVPSKFWQRCYPPPDERESFQIIRVEGPTFISAGSSGSRKNVNNSCNLMRDSKHGYTTNLKTSWNMPIGSMWNSKYLEIDKTSEECLYTCGSKVGGSRVKKEAINPNEKNQTKKDTKNKNRVIMEDTESNELNSEEEETLYDAEKDELDPYKEAAKDPDVLEERLKDNGRDTIRIANHLKKWIFHGVPGPKVLQKEFRYLQLARIVFLKSCPVIEGLTLTNFFRMFRYLVYESFRKRPESYEENTEEAKHQRILGTMQKCFQNVKPYKIRVEEDPCSLEENARNSKKLSVQSSPKGKRASQSISSMSPVPPKLLVNSTDIPFKVGGDSDTVLETVWKLMLHAHYQCSHEFKSHPEDLSWMFVKLQEFLTAPQIMFRWEHPAPYLNKVYSFLHPGFNLQRFAKIVDICVHTAKESSLFEDWIQRPRTKRHYLPNQVKGRAITLLGAKDEGNPTLFNGKGYCVNGFDEPLKWTRFNDEVNAKC